MKIKDIHILFCPVIGAYFAGSLDQCEALEKELMDECEDKDLDSPYEIMSISYALKWNYIDIIEISDLIDKGQTR